LEYTVELKIRLIIKHRLGSYTNIHTRSGKIQRDIESQRERDLDAPRPPPPHRRVEGSAPSPLPHPLHSFFKLLLEETVVAVLWSHWHPHCSTQQDNLPTPVFFFISDPGLSAQDVLKRACRRAQTLPRRLQECKSTYIGVASLALSPR
jgi:hypothetical protein